MAIINSPCTVDAVLHGDISFRYHLLVS